MSSRILYLSLLGLALLTADFARGQDQTAPVALQITSVDVAATAVPSNPPFPGAGMALPDPSSRIAAGVPPGSASAPGQGGQVFYPEDLSNPGQRPTIQQTQHHPIYINQLAPSQRTSDIGTFLTNLGQSDFIHLLDQYVNRKDNNRYTLGTSFAATLIIPADNTLRPPQLFALLHAAATQTGSGFGHLYHVFLPQGMFACYFGQCYHPGVQINFCAFHDYVTFSDVGTVIFTFEPYLDAPQCSALPGTPNGQIADTTYTFLSHEVFEAITDPLLDAWFVRQFSFAQGNEVADNCQRRPHGNALLNGKLYNVQPEYSNQYHGCAYNLAPVGNAP